MNTLLNYVVEANLGLILFLVLYAGLLRNETDFGLKRGYMLMALVVSVVFPLLHFNGTGNVVPRLSDFVPPTWLPEVVVVGEGSPAEMANDPMPSVWTIISWIYAGGLLLSLSLFVIRLSRLLVMMSRFNILKEDQLFIVESRDNHSSFSFFRFIFIGQADRLTAEEKQQIIDHEKIHASQFHSIDILLIQVYRIFFWFNPFLTHYQKIFVQLHEFEADARAVENRDVNNYCSLLAKVALLSADFKLANHFSNSLTLKRIEMMRTFKSKIRTWKIAVLLGVLPLFFFVVSCQDQVMQEANAIAQSSSTAIDLPDDVQKELDRMKLASPDKKFAVLEVSDSETERASSIKEKLASYNAEEISTVNVLTNKVDKHGNKRSFIIVEFNDLARQISESSKQGDDIFTVVEESAVPAGGMDGLVKSLEENMKYPAEARAAGKEGNVVVQFVVNKDGSLSDFVVLRAVDPVLDAEAIRVVKLLPPWKPGRQSGKPVRQRFVLPINFKLAPGKSGETGKLQEVKEGLDVKYSAAEKDGKKTVTGVVTDKSGEGIAGANVINVGTTQGTKTDMHGNFTMVMAKATGQLAISFVGYDTKVVDF